MARHQWRGDDTCQHCGVYRSGYSGGRTGGLTYYAWRGGPVIGDRAPACEPTARLADSVAYVNKHHPLPRCSHGNALRDGAGEMLEPSCGCSKAGALTVRAKEG
jgi:hypothetical protein